MSSQLASHEVGERRPSKVELKGNTKQKHGTSRDFIKTLGPQGPLGCPGDEAKNLEKIGAIVFLPLRAVLILFWGF